VDKDIFRSIIGMDKAVAHFCQTIGRIKGVWPWLMDPPLAILRLSFNLEKWRTAGHV
jgi:hypothetical protein